MHISGYSIKKHITVITCVQIFIVLITVLYTTISSIYTNYNETTNLYFQSAEKMLVSIHEYVSSLEKATLFPSQLYTSNNDSYLGKTLLEGGIHNDFRFYSYVDQNSKSVLAAANVGFISVYDKFGNGVACQSEKDYQILDADTSAHWYVQSLRHKTGRTILIPSEDFEGSGLNKFDHQFLCLSRTIIDINNTFKTVGICVAGIDKDNIIADFSTYRMAPNQKFAIYKNGGLLLKSTDTDISKLSPPEYSGVTDVISEQSRKIDFSTHSVYNNIASRDGYSIIIETPLKDIIGNSVKFIPFYLVLVNLALLLLVILCTYTLNHIMTAVRHVTDSCDSFVLGQSVKKDSRVQSYPLEVQKMFLSFNQMSIRINHLMDELLNKQKQKQELETQLLRTQINPHFLYNTLEIMHLKAYSSKDYDVSAIAELLGKNLQYGLRNTTKTIFLKEELCQLDHYLAILSYQYDQRIQVHKFIDETLLDQKIIKLVFQPIIENSVIHGIVSSTQILNIEIMGFAKEHEMVIQISDDGAGMDTETLDKLNRDIDDPDSQAIGLRNICRRIILIYGHSFRPVIKSKKHIGTTITLRFPLQGEQNYDQYSAY